MLAHGDGNSQADMFAKVYFFDMRLLKPVSADSVCPLEIYHMELHLAMYGVRRPPA